MTHHVSAQKLVWPSPPDIARIEFISEIICQDLAPGTGFFNKLKRFIAGESEKDKITFPYDVLVVDGKMFLTCQGIPYLIEVDLKKNSFKKLQDEKAPFNFPICLVDGGKGMIFITDCVNQAIYKYQNGKVKLFISLDLSRPTGITALPDKQKLYVIDTGEHCMKIFNYQGELLNIITADKFGENKFHFPTFITVTNDGFILVNDALNYEIKRFDANGDFISSFGSEGDGPGSFSRPKGIAADSEGNIYVIDNLFDNLQILNNEGQALLVIGSAGQQKGQFWSPSGIAIKNDTIYIADTFNNRIQILHFLGGSNED
jgi:DNA-binding beta-propeller fold protein YncE